MPVALNFDSQRYTQVSTLVAACAYGDEDLVSEILDSVDRDFAAAMLVILYSGAVQIAELADTSVEVQLQALGVAAAQAAEVER